ncbi:endonuclease [Clostridium folliculivorans]|uniref:Endonuclease n=1 Tax=Clostridium folliculivorans TaxID=2886038 RepID=A0A9W5Y0I1_9CLOT|nr:type I restriction endonuclease [Clostridium folliculivorans]GKU24355.1 endonuclease [Clostridium folliculivorans]
MDFSDQIKQFSKRAGMIKDTLLTEESTKTALIMPFFSLLGYDIFNPTEFVPEFTADFGIKKGEKVDYAIMKDGKPIILVECKGVNDSLTKHDAQLFRYFSVTESRFAILTNGLVYKFFTDLEQSNKMDDTPFLEINIQDISDNQIQELKKFSKDAFDIDTIFNTASELKYSSLIKAQLNIQLNNPTDDFVRFIINSFYQGMKTQNVIEKFRPIVKKSFQQFISDFMNEKLKSILNNNDAEQEYTDDTSKDSETDTVDSDEICNITTTEEELEAFNLIRSLLSEVMDSNDITIKDVERYCGILYKNNTRKWICRLFFNGNKKSIVIPDENKYGVRHYIDSIVDINNYKNELQNSAKKYVEQPSVK